METREASFGIWHVSCLWDFEAYQATCDGFEEVAGNNGPEKLSNPVEDALEDGDSAAESHSEGDSWVDMATRDVGANWDCNKESKAMADSNRN